ncbi:MAG: MATE family efflux transporter [Clostridia bacterium]|nr:MATE family efflux transporter [Clostridia bacterium]
MKKVKERIKLSEHFNYSRLFRFVLPSIVMMVFISVYGIVDGFFVANFAGELQFAALNLIFPLIMILGSVGFMLGTGGNAVVSKALGEGNTEKANRIFSMLVYVTLVFGVLLAVVGVLISPFMARLFAASEEGLSVSEKERLIEYCTVYARIILAVLPAFMLQNAFQGFFVTAEKPRLGLYVTVAAGLGNVVFDALFVAVFGWGLVGAALATALNQIVGGVLPLFYFGRKNDSLLRLGKTSFDGKTLGKVCINGLSELMTNISLSVVTIFYNAQLMRFIGIQGVSAYGVLQYIGFIFIGVFLGYSVGSAPIIGYQYGAQNDAELKNVYKKSLFIVLALGVMMTLIAGVFAEVLASVFVGADKELLALTTHGMRVYALCFVTCGVNIFASAFFTALSNGGVSLLISFSRTFVCQIIAVLVLPEFFGVEGVWASVVVAEVITLFLTVALFALERKRYRYL